MVSHDANQHNSTMSSNTNPFFLGPLQQGPPHERRRRYINILEQCLEFDGKDPSLSGPYYEHNTIRSPQGYIIEPADYCYTQLRNLENERERLENVPAVQEERNGILRERMALAVEQAEVVLSGHADQIRRIVALVWAPHRVTTSFDFEQFHVQVGNLLSGQVFFGNIGPLPNERGARLRRIEHLMRYIADANARSLFWTNDSSFFLQPIDETVRVQFLRDEIMTEDDGEDSS